LPIRIDDAVDLVHPVAQGPLNATDQPQHLPQVSSRHDWDRQTGVFGALLGRVAPLGWGNLGAALLDPFEQGAGVAFDLVVAARNRDG
jgi:hypothetical protein